jgi:hypothetical protein
MHLEFCHWSHTNHQLLPLILFTDEAALTCNEINITHNPHTVETNFQHRFSINVWCCMIDDMLIGFVILGDHMTGHNYLDFLQNGLSELEDISLATQIAMYFQHDGALSHYT